MRRTTVLAAVAFLDAFQKVADMATNTRGRRAGRVLCLIDKWLTIQHYAPNMETWLPIKLGLLSLLMT